MGLGQATKITYTAIREGLPVNPEINYPLEVKDLCCFTLDVFASPTNPTNLFENDFNSFIWGFSDIATSVVLELYKCDEKVDDLINDDYGDFKGFGFHEDGIKKYIGIHKLSWLSVYNDFGAGMYKVRVNVNSGEYIEDSFQYNLQLYTPAKADNSVRFTFNHNGIIGDLFNPKSLRSFEGLKWDNQLRLRGLVYTATPTYSQEEISYWNGETQDVVNELVVEYKALMRPIPYFLHKYLQIDVMQADTIVLDDYNSTSPLRPFLGREVKFNGGYEINQIERAKRSSATLTFKDKYQNFRKRFC